MDAFSLGQQLRQAREEQNYTLDDVEQVLKIRKFILTGFEEGNFNVIDASPVQIRGFLRNYCNFLGLDEEIILNYYDGILTVGAGTRSKRKKNKTQPKRTTQEVAQQTNTDTYPTIKQRPQGNNNTVRRLGRFIIVILLAGIALSVIAYVVLELITPNLQQGVSENPSIAENIGTDERLPTLTLTPSVTPTLISGTATLIPRSPQNYQNEPILVTIEFPQRTWISVTRDGENVYTGIVRPNEVILEYPATDSIEVTASNASALLVTYNGQPQPLLGARGEEVTAIYRPENDIEVRSSGTGYGAVAQASTSTPTIELLNSSNNTDDLGITPPPADNTTSDTTIPQPTSLPVLGNPTPVPAQQETQSDVNTTPTRTPTLPAVITITPTSESATVDNTNGESQGETPTVTPTQEIIQTTATPAVLLPERITSTPNIPPK